MTLGRISILDDFGAYFEAIFFLPDAMTRKEFMRELQDAIAQIDPNIVLPSDLSESIGLEWILEMACDILKNRYDELEVGEELMFSPADEHMDIFLHDDLRERIDAHNKEYMRLQIEKMRAMQEKETSI